MAQSKIAGDATLRNLTGKPAAQQEYVRRIVGNFHKFGPARAGVVVRIGTQGKGHSPHYKLEGSVPVMAGDQPVGFSQDTFVIYSGLNHEEMTAFDLGNVKDQNWSSRTMTFAEVETFFGDLRVSQRRV